MHWNTDEDTVRHVGR